MYNTFTDVIKNWPGGRSGFAEDAGIDRRLASSWRTRGIIPPEYWSRLVEAAKRRGFSPVTLDLMATIEAQRKLLSSG